MVLQVSLKVEESVSCIAVLLTKRHKHSLKIGVREDLLAVIGVLQVLLTDISSNVLGHNSAGKKSSLWLVKESAHLITYADGASDTTLCGATSGTPTRALLCLLLKTSYSAYKATDLTSKLLTLRD